MLTFFSRDEDDIIAVRARMDEHFKRVNSHESENVSEISDGENIETKTGIYSSRGNMMYASGLEDMNTMPASAPAANNFTLTKANMSENSAHNTNSAEPEIMEEMPSIDQESLDKLDKQIKEFDKQAENKPAPVDDIPEVEVTEIYTESENQKNEEVKTENNEKDDNNSHKEDNTMTPMEKMKKFAEEQIELNNKKIDELKQNKAEAENTAYETNEQLEILSNDIDEVKNKINELNDELETLQSKADALNEQNAEYASVLSEFDEQISEIEKENEEFKSYFK